MSRVWVLVPTIYQWSSINVSCLFRHTLVLMFTGCYFMTIYSLPHTKMPPASSIAPSTNEFGLDADVKAKFVFNCWVFLSVWQLRPQFKFILLVMTDASPGSIGAGDAATIAHTEKSMTQRDRMRRVIKDMLDGYMIDWGMCDGVGTIVMFEEQQEIMLNEWMRWRPSQ